MLRYFVPVLFFAALNAATVGVFRLRFGRAMPVTMMLSVAVVYLLQHLFHTWSAGIAALLLAAAAGLAALVVSKDNRGLFFSGGLVSFLVIAAMVTLLEWHRSFVDFDEFWHWGMMVKESLRTDDFYCLPASRMMIHKDYPPFLPILELIWVKFAGVYAEDVVTVPLQVFMFSCLCLPVLDAMAEVSEERRPAGGGRLRAEITASLLLTVLYMILINAFDHAHTKSLLLADSPLGVLFAFGLVQILFREPYRSGRGFFIFCLTQTAVVMTKQAGIAMALTTAAVFLVLGLPDRAQPAASAGSPPAGVLRFLPILLKTAAALALPLAAYHAWTQYAKSFGFSDLRSDIAGNGQFDFGNIDAGEYLAAASGRSAGLRHDTFLNLCRSLVIRPVTNMKLLPLSYVGCFVLLLAILCAFAAKKILDRKTVLGYGAGVLIGFAGYAFMLSVLFLFCFTPDEMEELRGYERYVDSLITGFLLPLVSVLLVRLYPRFSDKPLVRGKITRGLSGRDQRRIAFCAASVAILLAVTGFYNALHLGPQVFHKSRYEQYVRLADSIRPCTAPDDRISLVYHSSQWGGWYGHLQSVLYYCLNDRELLWGQDISAAGFDDAPARESVLRQIRESDALAVIGVDEGTLAGLEACCGRKLENNSVYRILIPESGASDGQGTGFTMEWRGYIG